MNGGEESAGRGNALGGGDHDRFLLKDEALTLRPPAAASDMARGKNTTERKTRSALQDVVAREYTIHLHTRVHGHGFKHVSWGSTGRPDGWSKGIVQCRGGGAGGGAGGGTQGRVVDPTADLSFVLQRAPVAVKAVQKFAQQAMGTKKVLIDAGLNAAIWDKGIKNVPHRIRVRLQRTSLSASGAPGAWS
jgi:large subunit ribosomal protein L31e